MPRGRERLILVGRAATFAQHLTCTSAYHKGFAFSMVCDKNAVSTTHSLTLKRFLDDTMLHPMGNMMCLRSEALYEQGGATPHS